MKMMESFFRTVIRFRWLVIGLVLGSTVLAVLPIQTLRFEGDIDAIFPADDPILAYTRCSSFFGLTKPLE